ncbi:hypothetical protein SLS62_005882 [Diatrype stigma]|uniref:Prolyl 4-hydroxylase alpha subunit Fe(2+) 2OG dioxygenase domain-containing protein n=1 Tax=Diatrype stigma TaxID=117547 RepID=A0AAN9V228_9PEZI
MAYVYISSDDEPTEGDSKEETGPSYHTKWKDDLATCLDVIETTGDFAGSKTYSAFVNPGLEVAGSPISLPLTLHDAETVRGACRQAPYGKGEATLVDESVRKTWELNVDQFSLANPDWNEFIQTLLRDVVHPLGMTNVRAEPYKLLLYEEGSFFKKHKDSEKAPGMIGTLVICLPAKHEGGDVRLSHVGRDRVIATGHSSAFRLTALAWYSDVTHEIMQVTSGYRLVLTYNLIQASSSGPSSAGFFAKQQKQLHQVISEWHSKYPSTKRLLYCLDHKYTQSSLSLGSLKGRDRAVCQTLYHTCLKSGLYLLFANLTYSEDDEDCYEEATLAMDYVYSPDGAQIAKDVDVDMEEIMGLNPYEERQPDSETETGYTGNEGMTTTQRYHDTAVMIVSKEYLLELLTRERGDGNVLYSVIQPSLMNNDADRILQASVTSSTTDEILVVIAELLNEAFKGVSSPQPDWDCWLGEYVSSVKDLRNLRSILDRFKKLLADDAIKKSFKDWQSSVQGREFDTKESFSVSDQDFIMKMMISNSANLEWIQSNLVPKLVDRGSKPLLYILIGLLINLVPKKAFPHSTIVAKDLFEAALEKLVLEMVDFSAPGYGPNTAQVPRIFIQFLGNCLNAGFTEQVGRLLDSTSSSLIKSASKKKKSPPPMPNEVASVQEFLQALPNVLQEHKVPPRSSVGDLLEALLRGYILIGMPECPKRLPGWKYKPRGCRQANCVDCKSLDKFLGATNEWECRFSMNEKRRTHLQSQLDPGPFHCTIDKTMTPYTLVVLKAGEGKDNEEDLKAYQSKLDRFRDKTKPIQHDYVKQLMGESRYRELVMLETPPSSEGASQPAKPVKRKKADDSANDPKPIRKSLRR